MADNVQKKRSRWTPLAIAFTALMHLLGVGALFVLMVGVAMPLEAAAQAIEFAWGKEHIQSSVTWGLAIQFGLAGCAWAMIYILFKSIDLGMLAQKSPRVVKRARGTVIIETLIAMPVLLLLILGMVQLSINNMAGILSHVASFQASRTAMVWAPEVEEGTIDQEEAEDRVRIAAALAMTPVAAGTYPPAFDGDLSEAATSTQDFMMARFTTGGFVFPDIPIIGNREMSIQGGLDGQRHKNERARDKFSHAYRSIDPDDVEIIDSGGQVGARVTYHHFQSMPLVGPIFDQSVSGGIFQSEDNFHFQVYELEYALPAQMYDVGRP